MRDHKSPQEVARDDYSRRGVMLVICGAHISLVVLWALGRLNFEHPSTDPLLQQVAASTLWVALHFIAACVVLVAAIRQRNEAAVLAFSAAVMGAWAVLRFLWALTASGGSEPLVGGVLGGLIALATYALCMSYSTQPPPRG